MTVHHSNHIKIKASNSEVVFNVMHQILIAEEDTDISREHFWVISLFHNNRIMNIELISLGSMNHTIVEPTEVFSIPLQKKAAKIILVHNHPSGELVPSNDDKDITDMLIQCGKTMHCPVIDHLIISTESYISFADLGLLAELEKSTKYALDLSGETFKRLKKSVGEGLAKKIATKMILKQKYELEEIKDLSGLTIKQLEKMKLELLDKKPEAVGNALTD